MPEMTRYENGSPCWVDIGTPDVRAAGGFYSQLFGWDIDYGPAEMGHYSMAFLNGKPVAALCDQQTPGVVAWSTYLAVDNVDTTVNKARAAGAAVLADPIDMMSFGRMAVLADTGGAPISLWQAGEHTGAGLVNEPGTMCWNELTTRAVNESIAFYQAVVGLTAHKQELAGGAYYELHTASGRAAGGLMPMDSDMWPPELPNHWMIYFSVEDTDAVAAQCVKSGGQAPVPPTDIPPGRFAVLNDPQGGYFSVIKLDPM